MMRRIHWRRRAARVAAFVCASTTALASLVAFGIEPAAAGTQILGAGSTWSQIAVDQWRADIASQGVSVVYQGLGSSTGRQFYIQGQADFGVSEIPFQPAYFNREGQQVYDEIEQASQRPYAYLPIVAGGTSFMYHLDVNGQRVTDLHLSGATVAKIFTGKITNWNDPAVAADDGRTFPDIPIIPVVRSDGSGTSAQFTAYMADMFPDIWDPFCTATTNRPSPCPATSLYPYFGNSKAQAQSDGVANFVSAPYNNGAITYVEYGYALQRGFPVVSVLNQAGYYVQPTAENVAIALTRARINPDRTQVLSDVYRNPDIRAYPVSSYSYMIVPTTTAAPFSTDKGDTLGRFIIYFLCTGQRKAKQLGYSPLPPNLVGFGFDAVAQIPGAPAPPPPDQCANPTITGEFSLQNAPPPSADDQQGAERPPIGGGGGGGGGSGGSGAATLADLAAGGGGTPTTARGSTRRGASGATGDTTGTTIAADGTVLSADGTPLVLSDPAEAQLAASAEDVPTAVDRGRDDVPLGVYIAVVVMVLGIVFGPPTLSMILRRKT
jgi:phosphate transport system substrate-binding protein